MTAIELDALTLRARADSFRDEAKVAAGTTFAFGMTASADFNDRVAGYLEELAKLQRGSNAKKSK